MTHRNPQISYYLVRGHGDYGNLYLPRGRGTLPSGGSMAMALPLTSEVPDSQAAVLDGSDQTPVRLEAIYREGLRMIHWELSKDLPLKLLWQAGHAGIWNHVSGRRLFDGYDAPGLAFADHPDLVHSFESIGGQTLPEPSQLAYGNLPQLSGIPYWQHLKTPRAILEELGHRTAKELQHLRLEPDTGRLWTVGSSLSFHFKPPEEIPPAVMDQVLDMVAAGGSVDLTHVRANLARAYLIAYVTEEGTLVANSCLKRPRSAFIQRMKAISGLDFTGYVERGYTSVRPEYRAMGIGKKLLEGLTSRATDVRIFSIISEDNLATQKIALRNHTRKIAVYYSEKTGKTMGVWMPEHMIEKEGVP